MITQIKYDAIKDKRIIVVGRNSTTYTIKDLTVEDLKEYLELCKKTIKYENEQIRHAEYMLAFFGEE